MRWPVFAIAAYLMLVLQVGLAPHIAISTGGGEVQPSFVLILAVFIALAAPMRVTFIACGILGLLLDLTSTYTVLRLDDLGGTMDHAAMTLIGPYTLGYMAGGYIVTQLRPMVLRQHPLTITTMIFAGGAAVQLAVLGLFSIRIWYEPMIGFSGKSELWLRGLGLLYSAATGLILGYPLNRLGPLFGFPFSTSAHRPRGRK